MHDLLQNEAPGSHVFRFKDLKPSDGEKWLMELELHYLRDRASRTSIVEAMEGEIFVWLETQALLFCELTPPGQGDGELADQWTGELLAKMRDRFGPCPYGFRLTGVTLGKVYRLSDIVAYFGDATADGSLLH